MKKQDIIREILEYYPEMQKHELEKKTKQYLKLLWETKRNPLDRHILSDDPAYNRVTTIIHISDIHIRVLDRHEEYKIVFDNLCTSIKSHKRELDRCSGKGLVVITGDIFHTKERLLSETIVLFNYFIKNLLALMPVIIIPGNHDSYLFSSRMDIITGLISIMQYPNLFYLKTPGVYSLGYYDFVFASPMTRELLDTSKYKDDSREMVCLYHGPLKNACSETGYSFVKDETLPSKEDFEGFDLVLLGDIHKHQFITDTMAYAGSLIQQSFKEDLLEHGYIRWFKKGWWQGVFERVPSDSGYLHYPLESLPDETEVKEWPKNLKIKFTLKDLDEKAEMITEFKALLEKHGKVIQSIQYDYLESETQMAEVEQDTQEDNIIKSLVKPEHYEAIQVLHNKFMTETVQETPEDYSFCNFEIVSLEFMNTFIYGEDAKNAINFETMPGSVGILANNASGKSSILNILIYALYGNVFKTKNYLTRNIIHKNKNNFCIRLLLKDASGSLYEIVREGRNRSRKDKKGMEEILLLRKHENGEIIELNDSNKLKTNDLIKQVLGLPSKADFILDHVMSYQHNRSVIGMINSEIEEMLSHIFKTDIYKKIKEKIKKKIKENTSELHYKKGQLASLEKHFKHTTENIVEIEKNRALLKTEMNLAEDNIKKTEKNIIKTETEVSRMKELLKNASSFNIKELKTKKEKLLFRLPKINEQRLFTLLGMTQNADIDHISKNTVNNKMDSIEQRLETLPKPKKKANYSIEYTHLIDRDLDRNSIALAELEEFSESEIEKYQNILYNKEFSSQQKQIERILKKLDKGDLSDDLINQLKEFLRNILEGQDKLTIYKNAEAKLNVFNKRQELLAKKKYLEGMLVVSLEDEFEKLNDLLSYIEMTEYIREIDQQMEDYEKNEQLKQEYESLKNTQFSYEKLKRQLEQKLESFKEKDSQYIKAIYGYHENKDMLEKMLEEKTTLIEQIHQQDKETEILIEYKKLLDDQNLPKALMKEGIKLLEREANKIMFPLCGLQIEINTEEDKYEILIYKHEKSMCLAPEQCSGFEKFCIDLGVKTAIKKLRKQGGLSLLFIDEVLDIISADNLDKIDDLLLKLNKYYKHVVLISHNEQLKDKVSHRVNIHCDGVSSKIIF